MPDAGRFPLRTPVQIDRRVLFPFWEPGSVELTGTPAGAW